ncbi:hydantoinase/oxoprolinase family protein [Natroniella sulfidigena]|uniref:hydantoinase/oxoprolinase family protein n=1 Tax=Natroniella sulfidigena TaxID=723921 RepID=UPI00200A3859|nr:hydantoinase/oxoprolinase family protein [Natroniella sulfidigena]MCK8817942.1 hydantoinase/oxoprolinase family protein [Natroniella sulfidigena]
MKKVLGIDTGGTYTDAVIYDYQTEQLIDKNKAITTHYDLLEGITEVITSLKQELLSEIELVALSTTLATNALVEGQGARVGLLLLGYEQEYLEKFKFDQQIPTKEIRVIEGKFDIKGIETEPLAEEKIKQAGIDWQDKVDAIAIAGYMSVRNPAHELRAEEILSGLVDLPLVCGHRLSSKLNLIKRATTVVLNASLIPLIKELCQKVKQVLTAKGIDAPLMIVKGDGSVVKDEVILTKPIETILSGPAASIIGAKHLSRIDDLVVVDMGGTTTDIALIDDGSPQLATDGAEVEDWQTCVESIKFRTIGLGGDSEISLNRECEIKLGPQRLIPYAVAATNYGCIITELEDIVEKKLEFKQGQFLILNRDAEYLDLNQREREVIELLESGPKSLAQLKKELELINLQFLGVERLERLEVIKRIGLTPTDILHVLGEYTHWSQEAAQLGYELLFLELKNKLRYRLAVGEANLEAERFAIELKNKVVKKVAREVGLQLVRQNSKVSQYDNLGEVIEHSFDKFERFNWDFQLEIPIVTIGAPAQAYLQHLSQYLTAEIIVPQDYEVANAVGAAVAKVIVNEELLIKKVEGSYILYYSQGREKFSGLNEALTAAQELGKKKVLEQAEISGAKRMEFSCQVQREGLGSLVAAKVICKVVGDVI